MAPAREDALLFIGETLRSSGYRFITPTPSTHARVLARDGGARVARDLRDVFGWNRPFPADLVDPAVLEALRAAAAVAAAGDMLRATVRYSTIDELLVVHSGYPTRDADAVFFGPDTYRFARLLERALPMLPRGRIVEVGCGSGAASLLARRHATAVTGTDVNPEALAFSRVNARLAGLELELVRGDILSGVEGRIDAVIANPPYLVDTRGRAYRDGGGELGLEISLRVVEEALERTDTVVLYTGTPIVRGVDPLRARLSALLAGRAFDYAEIDPDVFGEELEQPPYRDVDRIAVVGLVVSPTLRRESPFDDARSA